VAAPCVNLSGPWVVHVETDLFGSFDQHESIIQKGTVLEFGPNSYGFGSIDPGTGVFEDAAGTGSFWCLGVGGLSTGSGLANLDGQSFTESSVQPFTGPAFMCAVLSSTATGNRCGGGTLDPGEQCDDGNRTSGDGCNASCHLETCVNQPDGTPCDDGNQCTTGDACANSACAGVVLDDGTPCSDGNACTTGEVCTGGTCGGAVAVSCGACRTCDPDAGCVSGERFLPNCAYTFGPSTIEIKKTGRDVAVSWSWGTASGGSALDLGDPLASDDYALCIYDRWTAPSTLLFSAAAPAGGTCAGRRPCWRADATAVRYADPDRTPDGLTKILLQKLSNDGARAKVKGRGPLLVGRPFGLPTPPLRSLLSVQLQGGNGTCVAIVFDAADIRRNTAGRFKAEKQ
jgi:cysteine-rich repeat protein